MTTCSLRVKAAFLLFIAVICAGDDASDDYDTIVVGMGAAGTVAATTLARANKRVLALEGMDRIGGRVHTVPFGDGIVEMGAEWIHGTEDSRTYLTAIKNNITLLPQGDDIHVTSSDGSIAAEIVKELIQKGFSFEDENLDKPEPLGAFITKKIIDYIKEKVPADVRQSEDFSKQILRVVESMINSYEGSYNWNDINAASSFVSLGGNQHMSWHRNGYETLFKLLLNTFENGPGLPYLKIKLGTEVTKIEWPQEVNGKVLITTKDGDVYRAENVIVTMSLGVLKEKYESLFTPPLPQSKVTAIEKLQMGLIGKIILSFPNTWWPNIHGFYVFVWKDEDLKEIAEKDKWITKIGGASAGMGSNNTLTLWTSGDVAKQVEVMSEDDLKVKAMEILRRFMGANTTIPNPTGIRRSTWFVNEFTRGSYTYDSMTAAEVPTAREDLAAPLLDAAKKPRVLFAGEASHTTRFSTVHGAADTGHREAMRLLAQE